MQLNSYHGGSVVSVGFACEGMTGTVGVIEAGEYDFSTNDCEVVTILAGSLDVGLPSAPWRTVKTGDFYIVPKLSRFSVRATEEVAYLCEFVHKHPEDQAEAP